MRRLAISIALSFGIVASAAAADLSRFDTFEGSPVAGDPGWEGSLYAYGWMTSMDGQTGIDGFPPVDVDISFKEFIENLEFYAAGFGEIRRGRFGIAADLSISATGDGISIIEDTDLQVKTGGDLVMATLMGQYRIWEQRDSHVDLMAGARLWYFKDDIEIVVGSDDLGFDGKGHTWVDPMVGAKVRFQCECRLYFRGWAMIGGFGASSKIDWDLFGGVGYEFRENMSVLAGYRAVGVDYEGDELLFDVVQHGPMIGTVFEF